MPPIHLRKIFKWPPRCSWIIHVFIEPLLGLAAYVEDLIIYSISTTLLFNSLFAHNVQRKLRSRTEHFGLPSFRSFPAERDGKARKKMLLTVYRSTAQPFLSVWLTQPRARFCEMSFWLSVIYSWTRKTFCHHYRHSLRRVFNSGSWRKFRLCRVNF